MEKMTKRECLELLKGIVAESESVLADELIKFCDGEIVKLDKRAEYNRTKAAEKQAKGDELRDAVLAVLSDEFMTREQVTEALVAQGVSGTDGKELTVGMVGSRLSQLAKAGLAIKEKGKSRKMQYKAADSVDSVAEDAE